MSTEARPSKKQRELLSFIDAFIKSHGYGPSYREVMHALNYKSVSTVAIHVNNLIKKGHLRKRDRSARSLEVVQGTAAFTATPEVTAAQEKWLVDVVAAKFAAVEKDITPRRVDDLYVLVGALHVLDMQDAARSFKARLLTLSKVRPQKPN